jgi:hypothetical protein
MVSGRLKLAPSNAVLGVLSSCEEVSRMLNALRHSLASPPKTQNLKPKTS